MSTVTADTIPGYKPGTWNVDVAHSSVSFSVRHLMISKVKGSFGAFTATFVTGENPLDTKVTADVEVASITTNDENRDPHLRSADFFDAEKFPHITFESTGVKVKDAAEGQYTVTGNFTMKGVTKSVDFDFEFGGFGTDPYGQYKAAFTATAVVDRTEFDLSWNAPLETGGVLVGEKVTITLEIAAVLAA